MLAFRDESQEVMFCLWRGQHARYQPRWLEKDFGVVDVLCELVSCQQWMDGVLQRCHVQENDWFGSAIAILSDSVTILPTREALVFQSRPQTIDKGSDLSLACICVLRDIWDNGLSLNVCASDLSFNILSHFFRSYLCTPQQWFGSERRTKAP
jgi:hypothetical protein